MGLPGVLLAGSGLAAQLDDWTGDVRFASPTPLAVAPKASWIFECRTSDAVLTREVVVDRGLTLDLGNACQPATP